MKNILSEFMDSAADQPYRALIQHHIKKQSASELQEAVLGETSLLPDELQSLVINYIDEINSYLTYDREFWKEANCRQAFEYIIKISIDLFKTKIKSIEEAHEPKNQELSFPLFQIATLSIAYSASTQREQRKFMGIKKGIFR